ncbi:MAG: SGNH/GDSL hydrolase family protein, partial [Clostridiales bacterium]|nr:SGNH/GDSL hydrolase family protein [Clostridiales bacterium]
MEFHSIKESPFGIFGLLPQDEGGFLRFPKEVAEKTNDGVVFHNCNTAGGRLRFATNSREIRLRAVYPTADYIFSNMSPISEKGFDLYVLGENGSVYRGSYVPPEKFGETAAFEASLLFDESKMRECTIFFPLYGGVDKVEIGLDDGAEIKKHSPYKIKKPIVFYGSSITQGGCAGRPGNCYTSLISMKYDADIYNLGFSGSAKGETAAAEYIAGLDMSVFVMDYDHNAESPEKLESTHEPFFKIIRAAKPNLPVIFVSRPEFFKPINKGEAEDNERRRAIVRKTYENAVSAGDKNVAFVDGGTFADGMEDILKYSCTQDGT